VGAVVRVSSAGEQGSEASASLFLFDEAACVYFPRVPCALSCLVLTDLKFGAASVPVTLFGLSATSISLLSASCLASHLAVRRPRARRVPRQQL
jgi:hypothetical protein